MKKKLTILHANDLHGQLNFTVGKDLVVQGGISLMSGYVKKVRSEEPTFFGICGDVHGFLKDPRLLHGGEGNKIIVPI